MTELTLQERLREQQHRMGTRNPDDYMAGITVGEAGRIADRIDALEAERDGLREALVYARPFVEKWCHYQGDMKSFFDETLAPIDAALAKGKADG